MMQIMNFVPEKAEDCQVTAWLQPQLTDVPTRKHPAVVICPGGAYSFVSQREGAPVAKYYFAAGYSTFVLDYCVGEKAKNYAPLRQLAATVAHIRSNAELLHIDPNKIAVCGFSAGGHLAASLGVLHNNEQFLSAFPQMQNIRPDAMILGYPVITADRYTHRDTLANVSGGVPADCDAYAYWGLNTHVDEQTPPAFLWHTAADDTVPVENSLKFALALSGAKIPYELHVFPNGGHGMSVCNTEVNTPDSYNARWVQWSIDWLNRTLDWEA